MLKTVLRFTPTILAALIILLGVTSGAGVELLPIVALLVIQALVVGLPWAARRAGKYYGKKTNTDTAAES
jgi:hypothetical protein